MATKGPRPKEYSKLDDIMGGLVGLLNTRLTQDQASVIQKIIIKLELYSEKQCEQLESIFDVVEAADKEWSQKRALKLVKEHLNIIKQSVGRPVKYDFWTCF